MEGVAEVTLLDNWEQAGVQDRKNFTDLLQEEECVWGVVQLLNLLKLG